MLGKSICYVLFIICIAYETWLPLGNYRRRGQAIDHGFASSILVVQNYEHSSESVADFEIIDLGFNKQKSNISALDIDGDGDKDLLFVGEDDDGPAHQLYRNDGGLEFIAVESPFADAALTSIDWGDINGDGNLDVVQNGFGLGSVPLAKIFKSNDAGVFTEEIDNPIVQLAPSMGMADLNNDGYTDLYIFGNNDIDNLRPQLYFNDKEGGFSVSTQFDEYRFIDPSVTEVDIELDGDIDLFVMAGYEAGIDARFARLFINEGGQFTETDPGIIAKNPGHAEWGDYDNDGDLDLLINGDGFVNSSEDSDDIYRLYNNEDGQLMATTTFQTYRQISFGDGSRFFDWDNDGDLDILITGWSNDLARQASAIFINDDGNFTEFEGNSNIPGVSESAVEVSDLDDDGDLDLILSGFSSNDFSGEGSAFNRNVSLIVKNPTNVDNAKPYNPENLRVNFDDNDVTFVWDAPSDDSTPSAALSFNLTLVNTDNGYHHMYPLADTSTGALIVDQIGNVQMNKSWTIKKLPYGNYRWGVQAIDHSFAASGFSFQEFEHLDPEVALNVNTDWHPTTVFPNPSKGSNQDNFSKYVEIPNGEQAVIL